MGVCVCACVREGYCVKLGVGAATKPAITRDDHESIGNRRATKMCHSGSSQLISNYNRRGRGGHWARGKKSLEGCRGKNGDHELC